MSWTTRYAGTISVLGAVIVLVVGSVIGLSGLTLFALAFACILVGAAMVNGWAVLRRLLITIPTVFLVTAFTFYLQNGRGNKHDLAFNILGPGATEAGVAQVVQQYHLDDPLAKRYLLWLSDALRGDLGRSAISSQDVSTAIAKALPVSLQLMIYAQLMALLLAIPAGVYAAYKANRRGDRVSSTIALVGLSIPNFVLAIVLILIFALGGMSTFGVHLGVHWFPASRYTAFGDGWWEHFKHMFLPALALAVAQAAAYMRVLRSDMIATLQENFITTAKAKGLPDRRILWGHALRPSSFTLLTVFGVNTATLIGGALIIETIFSLPGLGTLLGTAIFQKDFLVVQGVVVVIAIGFILINFLVDLLYGVLDPRVRNVRA